MDHQGWVRQEGDNIFPRSLTYASYEENYGVPSLGYIRNFQIPSQTLVIFQYDCFPFSNLLEILVTVSNQSNPFRHENIQYWGNDGVLSMEYTRNFQIPSRPPMFFRYHCLPFSNMVEIPFGTVPSVQPFVHVPIFYETLQAFPWINIMRPSTLPYSFLPLNTINSSEAVATFDNSRNNVLDPATSLRTEAQDVTNLSPPNQTLNVSRSVPFLSNYDPTNGIHMYHSLPWAPGVNIAPQYPPRTAAAQIGRGPFNEMGNGSSGLSEEDILMHLRQEKFQSIIAGTSGTDECCCICQDEYADGDVLGKLECQHRYHFSCIEKWLMRKNTCPVCRWTVLTVARP